ncbi:Short-chain dehydrogenase/reductase SDR [Corchorus capsularis]|uniref:Short-chain dehydrogenase/reductase SDR n=1 Tax=Corchorus capsularis TaxID=210143 RepID=A0A1R3INQ4_COCAP|nr:Short-chain dehydrogenase/reductase SDR [Corchorus capsularis]
MDYLIDKLMTAIVATISLITLVFILQHYRFLNTLVSTVRTVFKENLAGKVVLITGASSGIGEHLAYQYARRGARLALVARRAHRLQEVADGCEILGSPETVYILGDVSNIDDCKRSVDATVNHFGRLDHLVTNAGVAPVCLFEDYDDITKGSPAMDINFWGSVYCTYFAQQHLKKSKGKIIVIASAAGWLHTPRMSFYSASKAALISFYETLRIEFGIQIGITIATPGLIRTEMTEGKFLSKEGKLEMDQEMKEVQVSVMPQESAENCAREIVDSACRGEKYVTVPTWTRTTLLWRVFWPEIIDWCYRMMLMTAPGSSPKEAPTKKMFDVVKGVKEFFSLDSSPVS